MEETTYDEFGRVFQQFDASGDFRGLRYVYNSHGYLDQDIIGTDRRGNVLRFRGNVFGLVGLLLDVLQSIDIN